MASIGGSLRTLLVAENFTGVEGKIYRDLAPPETVYPYMTIADELSNVPVLAGDQLVLARNRLVQVSLWQLRTAENVDLVDEVVVALDNAVLTATNQQVFRVRVSDIQRVFNAKDDTVLHAIILNIYQKAQ